MSATTSAPASLFDPTALAIVVAGTVIAAIARCGWRDCVTSLRAAFGLLRTSFDENANRTATARFASEVRQRGVLVADAPPPPDRMLAKALDVLVRSGSVDAMQDMVTRARAKREAKRKRVVAVFEQAGELAPVFGLVGTLFAMTQIAPGAGEDTSAATFGAIATAVLSSLYGVLTAHLVCFPIAGALRRKSEHAQSVRDELIEWLVKELSPIVPPTSKARLEQVA